MFVILSLLFATVLAHSYDTYIDLLPAEEKQPFMDKFSRRFMSPFENLDDRNKFDKELLGDQQGTGHLRRRRADYKSSDEESNAEEDLDVIPFNSNKDAKHDSDKQDSTSDDENASLSVPIQRRSYDTPKKKSDEVIHNFNVSADSKSNEKDTEEQLFDQTAKGGESLTEKFKDPKPSIVDFDVTTEQSIDVTSYSNASRTNEPNSSADENDLYVKKTTNNVQSTLKANNKSNEKRTVEQLASKKSNEEESSTEKFKDPEISTADFSMLTEEQPDMVSTTESQSFISEVTNYNALRAFDPNDSHNEKDLNIKKTIYQNKDDEVTENDSSLSESESNERNQEKYPKEKSKEEKILTKKVKPPNTDDIISTTESQDVESEEINYTAYEPTTYEPIVSGDTNDQYLKEDKVPKMTAKSILLLELDSNSTTASINMENKTPIRHRSIVHNTNDEGSVLTTDHFKSEQTFAHKQTSNILDSSLEDKMKNDDFTTDKTSTKSISLDINDRSTLSSCATEVHLTTTVNYTPISETLSPKVALTTSTTQTTILTTSPAAKTVPISKSPKKTRFQIINKPPEKNTLDNNIAKNVKRDNDLKQKKSINDKKIEVTTKRSGLPHYQVYEIPWPDSSGNPPFLKSDEPMRKLPFPAYKNSPNYLQYNPTNHLQPNAKNNIRRRDAHSLRKSRNQINETSNTAEPLVSLPEAVIKKDGELRKFGIYKKHPRQYEEELTEQPTILSPEDRTSEEENTVTDVELPDSNEQGHPIHSLSNGHLNVLKGLLFKKQINGEELIRKHEYVSSLFNKYNINNQNCSEKSADQTAPYDPKDPYKYEKNIDNTDYNLRKRGHRNRKANAHIKILHNLQVQNHHDQKMNNIFIANYVEDKNNHWKRIKMLTSANTTEEFIDLSTIANILKLSDEKDVFPALEKMQAMNLKLMRRNEDIKISVYLKALSDLIDQDSKALKQYDWLTTTVQIQSALEKLFLIIHKMNESHRIHPADIQILKYAMFLHNYLIELKRAKTFKTKLKEYVKLLSRDKSRRRNKGGTDEIMLRKVWDYIRKYLPDSTAGDGLNNLNEFLIDVEKELYDLHQAIRGVSMITKYNHQNWYNNLRQLYLTTNEKHLLQLLLHMSFSRLVELMEHSCENGLEDNYITYMKSHKKEAKRTLEELVFVMMVIDEIKSSLE